MSKFCRMLVAFLFVFCISISTCYGFAAHVVKVYDGDTITVDNDGQKTKVRMYGVDAPEVKPAQDYGQEARNITFNLVNDKDVEVTPIMKDVYGRIVGIVQVKSDSGTIIVVNEELLKTGSAWLERRYWKKTKYPTWENMEAQAKVNKIGLWANPNPVEPSVFRHSHK